MSRVLKKSLLIGMFLMLASSLSACKTTREERVMYGTFIGAGVGAGIGALGGGSALPGAAAGAFAGATLAVVIE